MIKKQAFTVIEVFVFVVIFAVLATIAIPYTRHYKKAPSTYSTQNNLDTPVVYYEHVEIHKPPDTTQKYMNRIKKRALSGK